MRTVRACTVIALIAQLALLGVLGWAVGLDAAGWVVGIASGIIGNALLARGAAGRGATTLGPADLVTLTRATLAGGVAALTAGSFGGPAAVPALVGLSVVALILDAVDGKVARRTGTVSSLGARFDMEVDAFLIAVLAVYVAHTTGAWWVLAIGAARYVFVAAGWLLPWLRGSLPGRYWRKVVAATQGIVLTVAAADVLPLPVTSAALAACGVMLAESFGRDIWWLRRASIAQQPRHRRAAELARESAPADPVSAGSPADPVSAGSPADPVVVRRGLVRTTAAWATTVLALALVWFALVAPNDLSGLTLSAFVRLPLEGLLVVLLALALPGTWRAVVALPVGIALGVLTLLKIIDMGFFEAFDRPFNPMTDWVYAEGAVGLLSDSIGRTPAILSTIAIAMLAIAVIVLMPLAVLHLTGMAGRHRARSFRLVTAFSLIWIMSFLFGLQIVGTGPVASTSAAALAIDELNQVRAGIADQENFAAQAANDSFGPAAPATTAATAAAASSTGASSTGAPATSDGNPASGTAAAAPATAAAPVGAALAGSPTGTGAGSAAPPATPSVTPAVTSGADLLSALKGKDVLIAFVESYGRVAVQDSSLSAGVDATLDAGTAALQEAGFSSRSAFLTSPTFGGISWLAHATLQSGLWVDSQQRYDQLVSSDRLTLTGAFKQAGWRTVADAPSNEKDWPEGNTFYHYDQIYDGGNVGYLGPGFGYASMPDQFIMSAFQQRELASPHAPVMAEIDLVSSHWPWAPLPQMVDWNDVGDGSVFDDQPAQGPSSDEVWSDPNLVRAAYGQSIQYALNNLVSFVQNFGDPNLVMVVLGDHQPAAVVSGDNATHDVPISIIAHDPAVLNRIAGWGWQDGLRPNPQAPLWPMDAFRDRFLTAFSTPPSAPVAKPR